MQNSGLDERTKNLVYSGDAFSRLDESDDTLFYSRARLVEHLDSAALATIENLVEALIREESPEILDLMASFDSHLKDSIQPKKVIGLGLNQQELEANPRLDERIVHDLNKDPNLPFEKESFDIVLNTVSIGYLTQPFEIFKEVERVLKPGGLFLVVYSNRMFARKAVKIWRETNPEENLFTVEDYFRSTQLEQTETFVVEGRMRPSDDKYAGKYLYSDPVYAVYAEKRGGGAKPTRRTVPINDDISMVDKKLVERRKENFSKTGKCPYCNEPMTKWEVPQTPFVEWPNEYMYVCFNNFCPYMLEGWQVMRRQGIPGFSYRLVYDPERNAFFSSPLPSTQVLRQSATAPTG